MRSSNRRESFLGYDVFLMAATHTFIHVLDRIFPALLPVLQDEFNLTYSQLGLMVSVPPLFRAFASIPCGYLADRFSSRVTIALSFLIQIFSALAVAWSRSPWTLVLSISTLALASTMYHPASLSYTTKLVSESNRSKAIGMQNAGGPLGMALGPLSLFLFLPYGWRFAYIFWLVPISLLFPAIWRLKPDEEVAKGIEAVVLDGAVEQDERGFRSFLSLGLVIFLVYSAVRNIGGRVIGSFLPLYLTDIRLLSVSEVSLILGSVSLTGVLAAPLGGFFADRFGNKRWLLMIISSSALCVSLAFLSPNTLLFIILYFSYRFFSSCGMPANSSIIARLTPNSRRGIGYALSFLPGSIVGSIIPTLAGFVADQMGLPFLFPLGISIMVASLVLLKFGVKVDRGVRPRD